MVSDGTGEIGAAKLTGEVLTIMTSVPGMVKNLTGVDITAQMSRGGLSASRVKYQFSFRNSYFFNFLVINGKAIILFISYFYPLQSVSLASMRGAH